MEKNGSYYSILGFYKDNGKKTEATIVYWGYILEQKMEATI